MKFPVLTGFATAALLGTAIATTGVAQSSPEPAPVSAAPAAVKSAVPALARASSPIPDLVKRAFDNAPDKTVNSALARPIAAALPDGSVSWVAPTADGACVGVPDSEIDAMAVVCGTTEEINARGLAIGTYGGDPETGSGTEIGVGNAAGAERNTAARSSEATAVSEADGSYARQIN